MFIMDLQKLKELFLKFDNTTIDDVSHINYDLNELLILEKKRLGFKEEDLVFISAGDFSRFYWCSMQAYFAMRKNEVYKFSGCLQDRIEYSIKLGKLDKIPKNKEELLLIGRDISLKDIFDLMKREEYQNKIGDDVVENARQELEKNKSPQERGHLLETIYARKLPQLHWFVRFDDFIFTCEPDGIGENYVYEFKSSKNRYFSVSSIEKAKLQSDIYAICFDKENKLIEQLIISKNNKIEIIKEEVDIKRVGLVINSLKEIISAKLPKLPKEKFKCRGCEYKKECQVK